MTQDPLIRRRPRLDLRLRVYYHSRERVGKGMCLNINVGGMLLRVDEALDRNAPVDIMFHVEERGQRKTVRATGKILRVQDTTPEGEPGLCLGIEFMNFKEGKDDLELFLAGKLAMNKTDVSRPAPWMPPSRPTPRRP